MLVSIDYEVLYIYDEPVSFSPLTLRILPRPGPFVRWLEWSLKTDPVGDTQHRIDHFSNQCLYVFFDTTLHEKLRASGKFELALTPRNPFHFLVESRGLEVPVSYTTRERFVLSPFLGQTAPERLLSMLPFRPFPDGVSVVEGLTDLLLRLHELVTYEARETGHPRPPVTTLTLRRGACRDTAILLDAILREMGFAARLVSGFLCEFQTDPGKRLAKGAMHAWNEVFLPGAGWIGVDATNGVFCDHHYLPTAVGITAEDIAPISGSYYSTKTVSSRLESKILLTQDAT